MNDVNWWLMALSFILGLLLTFAFMIRRVTREVPIYAPLGRGPKVGVKGADVDVDGPTVAVKGADLDVDAPTVGLKGADLDVKAPGVDIKGAGLAAGAAAVGAAGAAAAKLTGDEIEIADEAPFGAGSVRLAGGSASGPSGYTIKGNEDSMLYHTTESPFYDVTIAEVWFKEAGDAERAGFTRWDLVGGKGSGGGAAKFADVPPGPYGAGSAKAGTGGTGPEGWTIKGNEDSMLYHTTDSPSYKQTIAEVWFFDEETAAKAGFKRWDINRK